MIHPHLDEDDDSSTSDPFRLPWYGRVLGTCFWMFDAARFWLSWPVIALGHAGQAIARGIGWYFGWLMYRLSRWSQRTWWAASEFLRIEGMRHQVDRLQQQAARSAGELGHVVQDHTTQATWFRTLAQRLGDWVRSAERRWLDFLIWTEESAALRWVTAPLRVGTQLARQLVDFGYDWLESRDFRHLLYGLPAVILLLPLIYCAARMPFYSTPAKAKHYRAAAEAALSAEDYAAAELYFRKLAQLGDVHERVTFRSALVAQEQGDIESAYEQMKRLAPLEGRGFFEAHWWIGQQIISGAVEVGNPAAMELAEQHFRAAANLQPDNGSIHLILAELALRAGRDADVRDALNRVAIDTLPWSTRIQIANVYARLGDTERSRRIARTIAEHFSRESDSATMTVEDYLAWAVAQELLERVDESLQVLYRGLQKFPQEERLTRAVSEVGAAYLDQQPSFTDEDWIRKRKIIETLLSASEQRGPLLVRLVGMLNVPSVAADARRILEQESKADGLPAPVYRALADQAVVRQDWPEARKLYQQAIDADPQAHAALNNLAYILGNYEPTDLPRALELANQALANEPENPHYLETRGQIRLRMKQWTPAADDLVRALNGMPDKKEIHSALALAYRELGMREQAAQHEAQARR